MAAFIKLNKMEEIANIYELVEAADAASSVKSISYSTKKKEWTVSYYDLLDDRIDTESLVEYLRNG